MNNYFYRFIKLAKCVDRVQKTKGLVILDIQTRFWLQFDTGDLTEKVVARLRSNLRGQLKKKRNWRQRNSLMLCMED